MKEHLAHIAIIDGNTTTQTVKEHCLAAADYAAKSLKGLKLYHTGYLAGLLHDMGKGKEEFTQFIMAAHKEEPVGRGSVNHTFAAVIFLLDKYHNDTNSWQERISAEIISYACGSHHGIFDCVDILGANGFEHRRQKNKAEIHYDEAKNNFFAEVMPEDEIDALFSKACREIEDFYNKLLVIEKKLDKVYFLLGTLTRTILSAVIDGDRRDTAEFCSGKRICCKKMCSEDWKAQLDYLEEKIKCFPIDNKINRIRGEISNQCREFAHKKTGIYKIAAPTGAGKTLATLRFALAHAMETGKERVLFIIPLLSILDQNASVIREYIKDESLILEHHSNVIYEENFDQEQLDQYELLIDNWDAPIVVSTLVQLLNTFFSQKSSAIRKLKSLCNSVIVIDEIQSLPIQFTHLFNQMINFLVESCNTTVLLSSATQPCFNKVAVPMHIGEAADMVKITEDDMEAFKRVSLIDRTTPNGMTLEEVGEMAVELISTKDSLLIVCNTKVEARVLYRLLEKEVGKQLEIHHLSTGMCKAHRKQVLEKIGNTPGLKAEKKVICVSTQLVEAGIDFSFQCVIRFEAGIENIVQAAGRCNRNNEWGKLCYTYIIRIKNEQLGSLEEIKTRQNSFNDISYEYETNPQKFGNSLMAPTLIEAYYELLFSKSERELNYPVKIQEVDLEITDMLSAFSKILNKDKENQYFLRQCFKTAGEHCKVFDDDTMDVIVPFDEEGKKIIANLCSRQAEFDIVYLKLQIEKAKAYTVSLYDNEVKRLGDMIKKIADESIYILKQPAYDYSIGVCVDGKIETEDFLIS